MTLLETLPGWPEAPEVSTSWMLLLMFGLPLALGAVIALLTWVPRLSRRFQSAASDSRELAPTAPRGEAPTTNRDDLTGPDAEEMVADAAVANPRVPTGRS